MSWRGGLEAVSRRGELVHGCATRIATWAWGEEARERREEGSRDKAEGSWWGEKEIIASLLSRLGSQNLRICHAESGRANKQKAVMDELHRLPDLAPAGDLVSWAGISSPTEIVARLWPRLFPRALVGLRGRCGVKENAQGSKSCTHRGNRVGGSCIWHPTGTLVFKDIRRSFSPLAHTFINSSPSGFNYGVHGGNCLLRLSAQVVIFEVIIYLDAACLETTSLGQARVDLHNFTSGAPFSLSLFLDGHNNETASTSTSVWLTCFWIFS